jgi:NAD(P)-dependent dehydrogenase (short-subunit alcohol dehydrogenase family)
MQDPRTAYSQPPFKEEHSQDIPGREHQLHHPADHGEESYKGRDRLTGRKALITGGDSGIGRAVAIAYAKEGADVAIAYWQEDADAQETCAQVEKVGRKAVAIRCDLAEVEECKRVVNEARDALGGLDILVNNAALQGEGVEKIEDISADRIERTFRTNIIAMFHLVKAALAHMPPGSSIINVSSVQGFHPSPPILDYATTKGAIVTFTRGLAKELMGRGIRVNSVAPGPVWTPLPIQSFPDEKIEHFGEQYPIGRPAQPIEMATAFVYLASDEASYINGEIVNASGGKPY